MRKIDKKDRRLLFELDRNARASYVDIAKQVGMSAPTVRYRIERLVRLGIIAQYYAIINTARFGYAQFKVLLQLQSVSEDIVNELIAELTASAHVTWVVRLEGSFDVGFTVRVARILDLSTFLDTLAPRYGALISRRSISVNVKSEYLTRDYLVSAGRRAHPVTRIYEATAVQLSIDTINEQILRLISADSRISAAQIAAELPHHLQHKTTLTPEAILQRIKRLQRERVITGYNLVLEHRLLQQLHYKVLLYFNRASPEIVDRFVADCKTISRIVYIIKALGEWDYEIDLEVLDVNQFREIMMELSKRHPLLLRDYSGFIVTKIHKYLLCP